MNLHKREGGDHASLPLGTRILLAVGTWILMLCGSLAFTYLVIIGLALCTVGHSYLRMVNTTGVAISNIVLEGQGQRVLIRALRPGATVRRRLHVHEWGMWTLSFEAGGRRYVYPETVYVESISSDNCEAGVVVLGDFSLDLYEDAYWRGRSAPASVSEAAGETSDRSLRSEEAQQPDQQKTTPLGGKLQIRN